MTWRMLVICLESGKFDMVFYFLKPNASGVCEDQILTIKLENHFIVEKYSEYEESGLVAMSYCSFKSWE